MSVRRILEQEIFTGRNDANNNHVVRLDLDGSIEQHRVAKRAGIV